MEATQGGTVVVTPTSAKAGTTVTLSGATFEVVGPDGDTIGCAAGLCRALRLAGKEAFVLKNPEATSCLPPIWRGCWPRRL